MLESSPGEADGVVGAGGGGAGRIGDGTQESGRNTNGLIDVLLIPPKLNVSSTNWL